MAQRSGLEPLSGHIGSEIDTGGEFPHQGDSEPAISMPMADAACRPPSRSISDAPGIWLPRSTSAQALRHQYLDETLLPRSLGGFAQHRTPSCGEFLIPSHPLVISRSVVSRKRIARLRDLLYSVTYVCSGLLELTHQTESSTLSLRLRR